MAQTITPVVHGGRPARWARVLGLHVLGATSSAALLGAALGAGGMALGAPWGVLGIVAVLAVAGAYSLRELAGLPVPVPELRRQVPEWWRSAFSPGTAAALYGLGLGVGFATHLRHGTLVAVGVASVASGDSVTAAVAMGAFGLARSLAVGAAWLVPRRRNVGALTAALERLAVSPGSGSSTAWFWWRSWWSQRPRRPRRPRPASDGSHPRRPWPWRPCSDWPPEERLSGGEPGGGP